MSVKKMEDQVNTFLIEKAARFLSLCIEQQAHIRTNREFLEYMQNYKDFLEFRNIVNNIAQGFSLEIIGITDAGLILIPQNDSIFAQKTPKMKKIFEDDLKILTPLILTGLAAYYFPRKDSFNLDLNYTEPFNFTRFDDYLRSKCREFKDKSSSPNTITGNELSKKAYEEYLALPTQEALDSKARNNSSAILKRIIEHLTEEKLFIKRDGQYWLTNRFKIQMDYLASNNQMKELIDKFRSETNA